MRTVIIGSGNTATVLGKKFLLSGHEVMQVVGRSHQPVAELAAILKCGWTTDLLKINRDADIYIMAIADDAIAGVAGGLDLDKKLVVHTAGSVPKDVLQPCSRNYGILYPLQSLRKEIETVPEIPFLVDGNTPDDLAVIGEFAATLSPMVKKTDDEQRLKIHLAAVMVSNFTNHLYTLADQYCRQEGLDFNMLHPLISDIAERIKYFEPATVQTGPAVRHDTHTINKHLDLLKDHPELKEFYALFTQRIEEMYRN
jgi:predicted short-subunit dehydrogenase-like oxidoreductase (DUF2520 family)